MSKFCVGLTGNIGSGKSTVAAIFRKFGVDVWDADAVARSLTARGEPAFNDIVSHFGNAILQADGELDRSALGACIFEHPEERKWLESLLHPQIREALMQSALSSKGPWCIVEIPLLYDRSLYPWIQRILLVTASVEQQVSRLMARNGHHREHVLKMLAAQMPDSERRKIADDILENTGSLEALEDGVRALYARYNPEATCAG